MSGYTATYSTDDIKPAIIDVIVGALVVLADIIEPYMWVIVAGILITLIFGFIGYFRKGF